MHSTSVYGLGLLVFSKQVIVAFVKDYLRTICPIELKFSGFVGLSNCCRISIELFHSLHFVEDMYYNVWWIFCIRFNWYERTHPNFVSAAGIEIFGLQIGRPSKFLQGLWASFLCPLGTKRG